MSIWRIPVLLVGGPAAGREMEVDPSLLNLLVVPLLDAPPIYYHDEKPLPEPTTLRTAAYHMVSRDEALRAFKAGDRVRLYPARSYR